jgi:hypothetical protein
MFRPVALLCISLSLELYVRWIFAFILYEKNLLVHCVVLLVVEGSVTPGAFALCLTETVCLVGFVLHVL